LQLLDSRNTIVLYRISQTDNASYAGTKANYNACFLPGIIVQQSFQPPACDVFSDEFKFTYKNRFVLTNQTSCSGSFSHDALKGFCFVWFKSFGSACCNDGLRQGMFREISVPVQASSSWRLVPFSGKHQKRLGIHK
jgi:hypothetical protein